MKEILFAGEAELDALALSLSLDPGTIEEQAQAIAQHLVEKANGAAKQPFMIDSEDRANWFLRKVGNLQAERARITAQYEEQIADLDRREKSLKDHFLPQLEAWASDAVARLKKRSITLLHGTLLFKKIGTSEAMEVIEKEVAENEARARGFVKDVPIPVDIVAYRKAALAALKEDGEIWPGLDHKVTEERDSFRIEFPVPGKPEAPK